MTEANKATSKQMTQAQKVTELESKLADAMNMIEKMQDLLKVVEWQGEDIMRRYQQDPVRCIKSAREIAERNLNPKKQGKRYTWRIDRPSVHRPMFFESDSANERTAIAEWQERLGTKFVTNRQRDDDNDKIELVKDAEAEAKGQAS